MISCPEHEPCHCLLPDKSQRGGQVTQLVPAAAPGYAKQRKPNLSKFMKHERLVYQV